MKSGTTVTPRSASRASASGEMATLAASAMTETLDVEARRVVHQPVGVGDGDHPQPGIGEVAGGRSAHRPEALDDGCARARVAPRTRQGSQRRPHDAVAADEISEADAAIGQGEAGGHALQAGVGAVGQAVQGGIDSPPQPQVPDDPVQVVLAHAEVLSGGPAGLQQGAHRLQKRVRPSGARGSSGSKSMPPLAPPTGRWRDPSW